MTTKVLVVDNYDSFVFNLVHYLAELGAEVVVTRNDERSVDEIAEMGVDGILLSPGPGRPEEAGVCVDVIRRLGATTPVLGVCLGHQAIAVAFGGAVEVAPELLHGKVSQVHHDGAGVLNELPDPFTATRYHSLAVVDDGLPAELEVTGRTDSGVIMAMRHRDQPVEGVQFHPESVLTEGGHLLLANWLRMCGDPEAMARVPTFAAALEKQRAGVT